jgi:hypothetical protein
VNLQDPAAAAIQELSRTAGGRRRRWQLHASMVRHWGFYSLPDFILFLFFFIFLSFTYLFSWTGLDLLGSLN